MLKPYPDKMKFLLLRKFLWLILFTLIHVYFLVFNWELFKVMLNIDLGFGVIRLPPFVILFLTGFIIIGIQCWVSYLNNLRRIIYGLKRELETNKKERKLNMKLRSNMGRNTNEERSIDVEQSKDMDLKTNMEAKRDSDLKDHLR